MSAEAAEKDWDEADVTINGTRLTRAQAVALRVAVTAYHGEMGEPDALGGDEMGRKLAKAYRARISEVLNLIVSH